MHLSSRPGTLHDFHSHEIAEQLTLLDAELFYKIEVRRGVGWGTRGCCLSLNTRSPHRSRAMGLLLYPVCFLLQIPEVLLWAKEQNEEKSPNLTQFTEHFNNMSYW